MYSLKNRKPITALIISIVVCIAACNFSGRTKTVEVNNNEGSLKIEYHGSIAFSEDGRTIENISPNGYIHYKNDFEKITIESNDSGELEYAIYANGNLLNGRSEEAGKILRTAIKDMDKYYNGK
jgi:hypothetical protein